MALGAMTHTAGYSGGANPLSPIRYEHLSFAGDGAYAAGGTAGFQALVRSKLGATVTVLAVKALDCGGYHLTYDNANDKLKVWHFPTAQGPMIEDTTANQSGRTYNVLVICA